MDNDPDVERLLAEGLAASTESRSEDALELFTRAARLAPSSGVAQFLIGSERASRGEVEAAELAFANAVLLAPDFALARYQLGLLQFSSQRASLALLTWEPLLSLPADQPLPHFVRGFAALAQDRFDEALGHFRGGLACPKDNPALFADVAQVVEAVERLVVPPSADGTGAAASHVLLNGYARGLH